MLRSMALVRIASLDDPRLEPFRSLKNTNVSRWQRQFVAEGEKLVRRLLASDFEVLSVLADERHAAEFEQVVPGHVPLLVVGAAEVPQIVGFNFHRGVLACGRRPEATRVADWLAAQPQCRNLVVCSAVHDPENLGSIVRTSAALGADGVIVGSECCDVYSRRVLRVSMGSVLQLPILVSSDLAADLEWLRDEGDFELIATVLAPDAQRLEMAARADRLALVLGSEGHGLDSKLVELCQRRVTIEMDRGTDSLNVSVAAGILLHHFLRAAAGKTEVPSWPSHFQENL